ncbi:MAG: hypothetical protein R2716_12420 [Microthrixaceae bacterium]
MSLKADLLSLSSTLDQLIERLEGAAEEGPGTDADDLLGAIYDVERHLRAANRRLNRTLQSEL